MVFADENSAVFKLGNTVINLLKIPADRELIDPGTVAGREAGARFHATIGVDDVDAVCAELARHGVRRSTARWTGLGNPHSQLHRSRPPHQSGSPVLPQLFG
jgi:hypothetical protein